jgi:hypothetical protein
MSAGRLILLASLVAATALGACREITAPGTLGDSATPKLLVLDIDGSPVTGRTVWLTSRGHVPAAKIVEWDGRTSDEGTVTVDLPPGTYVATFPSSRGPYLDWVEPRFELRPATNVVRAGTHDVSFALDVPDVWNASFGTLWLYGDVALPTGTHSFDTRLNLDEDGRTSGPWLPEATYDVVFFHFDAQIGLARGIRTTPADTLRFGWEPGVFQVRITLGGAPLQFPGFAIQSRSPGADVTMPSLTPAPVSSFYANEGLGQLIVQSRNSLPFMDYSAPYEFRTDQVPEIELGDHRIEFLFETTNGTRPFEATLQIFDALRGSSRARSSSDGRTEFYLRPGQYRLVGRVPGFEPTAIVADIASDSTFTFVLEPEAP